MLEKGAIGVVTIALLVAALFKQLFQKKGRAV